MTLLDSGERKEFKTGAVRDISDGKGRCDLLPWDVVDLVLKAGPWSQPDECTIPQMLNAYILTGGRIWLIDAVKRFVIDAFDGDVYTAFLELSKHYEDGAKKYSPNNWKLGIDLHCFIDSAGRHYLKWLRGDDDEPHDRAVLWNLVGAIWTHENLPEMNDIHGKGDSKICDDES